MNPNATIADYLKDVSPAEKAEFERVRKLVIKQVPNAEESISYGMPTFKFKGRPLLYFGVFKDHMSLFPGAPLELKDKLKDYKTAKGTIQFTLTKPLPADVIEQIIKFRLAQINKS